MPGEIEIACGLLGQAGNPEARQDALEILPVQHVELRELRAARTDLLHRGLVLAAPGIREGEPIKRVAERAKDRFCLARDRGAPVGERAEHVEQ